MYNHPIGPEAELKVAYLYYQPKPKWLIGKSNTHTEEEEEEDDGQLSTSCFHFFSSVSTFQIYFLLLLIN